MEKDDDANVISDELISKINAAGLINLTTNNLWVDFFNDFRKGKYLSANNDLDCIWTILGGEKGIEGKEDEKEYLSIETSLKNCGILEDGFMTKGFSKISNEFINKSSRQKGVLLKKSLFLRRLQNKQGKGTAYERGESDYMDG